MDQTFDMDSGAQQIRSFIGRLAERRTRVIVLGLVARLAVVVAVVWAAVLVAWVLVDRESTAAQTLLTAVGTLATIGACVFAWRRRPAPAHPASLARLAEDHLSGLDDRLVTAVDVLERRDAPVTPLAKMLLADTARRVSEDDVEIVIPQSSIRAAAWRAVAALAFLAVVGWFAREPVGHVGRAASVWLFPGRLALEVAPGDARVPPATPFVVRATTADAAHGLVPEITVRMEDATRSTRMKADAGGGFTFGVESVPKSFSYQVRVAGSATREYHVTLLEHPRVGRIDLAYTYPAFARMAPRTEVDGGDIYAPEGSRVTLRITPRTTSAPVREAALVLRDGSEIALSAEGEQFVGVLPVTDDTAYRVRLRDADGLENVDDPEYFVRRLDDRPPDVRIVRPAGDRQVTPLEEVTIEARADDDHGIERLELVVGVRGGREKSYPLGQGGLSVTGRHTVYLEDLEVSPGDFVSFYARARDVARGKRSTQAQSDIYFLEVTPFVDEFAMAQSQAMSGASGQQMDDLVRLQKDIISGTWKLQRRAEGAGTRPVAADVKTLGRAQGALRRRAEAAARQAQMLSGGGRRGRPGAVIGGSGGDPEVPAMMQAARAMARAETSLEAVKPTEALPAEMEALNHLLKAQAEIQRKEIARQQANGGGAGSNRNQQDLSALFDRELQRQQETNYETPQSVEERQTDERDELLDRVRELARRQEALARQQSDLARDRQKMDQEEVRRRLERLTRDQMELRRQAEQLAQQLQQQARQQGQQSARQQSEGQQSQGQREPGQAQGQQSPGQARGQQAAGQGQPSAAQAGAQALREASEDMRAAASDLRREAPDAARDRAARALDRLQSAERGLEASGPDERRRAAGDAQLEARQLAERQRQLADETARAGKSATDDTRRRLAGEQQRLAERADALESKVSELAASGSGGDRETGQRLADAARAFEQGKVGQQMRSVAEGVRRGEAKAAAGEPQRALARELDRLADRVGGTAGAEGDREATQIADELAETRGLRERLNDLQRQIEQARQQAEAARGQAGERNAQGRNQGRRSGQAEADQEGQGADARRLAELQRQYLDELRQAGDVGQRLGESSPGTGRAMSTPVDQQMVTSAPGTEAFKQDFSRWEALTKEIALGLEKLEAGLSQRVVERAARDRLRAGELARVPDAYRATVDRYYRALAEDPK